MRSCRTTCVAKRRAVSLEELQNDPFLLLRDGHCFRETAVAACKRARLNPKIIFESGQFSSILSMVGAGLGVSIVPAMAVEKRSGCRYVSLTDERAARGRSGSGQAERRSPTRATEAFPTNSFQDSAGLCALLHLRRSDGPDA